MLSFPHWDKYKDARLTAFNKFINVHNSAQLTMTFINFYLSSDEWWVKVGGGDAPISDRIIYLNELSMFAKLGLVQFTFATIESTLRILLKHIAPTACAGGFASFESIYKSLLCTHLNAEPPSAVTLLELLREVRNTIHNNGVYFSKNGTDKEIFYNGMTYSFEHSKPVGFLYWSTLLNLTNNIRTLLFLVVSDPKIANEAGLIYDPFAAQRV